MAATFGATTYASVVWTAGDIITEAKLDNMVANDQAYDSHRSQGYLADNNKSFGGKNAGGTVNQNLIKIDGSDIIQVGEDNVGDHTAINAGTSKLVKTKTLRQNATTDAYQKNTVILSGWGSKQGDGTGAMTQAITFGITFSSQPVVLVSDVGNVAGAPTGIDSFNSAQGPTKGVSTINVAVGGFTVHLGLTTGTFSNTYWYGYSWIAIGELD